MNKILNKQILLNKKYNPPHVFRLNQNDSLMKNCQLTRNQSSSSLLTARPRSRLQPIQKQTQNSIESKSRIGTASDKARGAITDRSNLNSRNQKLPTVLNSSRMMSSYAQNFPRPPPEVKHKDLVIKKSRFLTKLVNTNH